MLLTVILSKPSKYNITQICYYKKNFYTYKIEMLMCWCLALTWFSGYLTIVGHWNHRLVDFQSELTCILVFHVLYTVRSRASTKTQNLRKEAKLDFVLPNYKFVNFLLLFDTSSFSIVIHKKILGSQWQIFRSKYTHLQIELSGPGPRKLFWI